MATLLYAVSGDNVMWALLSLVGVCLWMIGR